MATEVRREEAPLLGGRVSWLATGHPDGSRPSIVLLHGLPSSAELWRGVLEHLGAAGWHGVAPDLPGYGRTRIDHGLDHGIEGAVDLAQALIGHLGGQPVWLVGHDLGAVSAQLLAIEGSAPLAGLTLSHAPIEDRWPPAVMQPVFAAARRGLARVVAPQFARVVARAVQVRAPRLGLAGDPWRAADARRVFADGKVATAGGRAAFTRHVSAIAHTNNELTSRTAPALSGLTMPTQLIWGNLDTVLPWHGVGDRLRELLPDPAVTIIDGAGHYCPGERPAQFAAALLHGAATGERT